MMNKSKFVYGIGLITLSLAVFFLATRAKNKLRINFNDTHWDTRDATPIDSLPISGIKKLQTNGNCTILLIPSDEERVVFYYNKKEVRNLSSIKDSMLYLDFKQDGAALFSFNKSEDIAVKIYTKSINNIVQEGVGSIKGEGILVQENLTLNNQGVGNMEFEVRAKDIELINEGVGSIELKGSAEKGKMTNGGTGSIDAERLLLTNAVLSNQGVGSISVQASGTLDMVNQGIGSITYSGNATITRSLSEGVGSINKR